MAQNILDHVLHSVVISPIILYSTTAPWALSWQTTFNTGLQKNTIKKTNIIPKPVDLYEWLFGIYSASEAFL